MMPALTAAEPHTPTSGILALIRRRPVTAYLMMAFTGLWLSLLPVLFLDASPRLFSAIGAILGLALPAFLVTAVTDGRDGVLDLLARSLLWRVGVRWYALALLGIPVGMVLIAATLPGAAPLESLGDNWTLLFTVFAPKVLLALLTIQLFEEIGWAGFVQHRLQDRHGAFLASLMVAPAFALIHLPFELIGDPITVETIIQALAMMIPAAIFAVFLRVLITWSYNGSGRSVLIAALLHVVLNTVSNAELASAFFPRSAAMWLPLAAVAAFAALATTITRGRLAYGPVQGYEKHSV